MINAVKIKLQSTVDEAQDDSLIVREGLEGNDDDKDSLARDLALLSLIESRLTVGELLVKLKRLGDTKYLTATLAKIEDALK